MECSQLIDTILAAGRVTVLILGMLAGTFSVYLGWKLYRDAVISKTAGEITYKAVRIALTATGPGVFLALFGSYLMYSIVEKQLDLSEVVQPADQTTASKPVIWQAPRESSISPFLRVQAPAVAPAKCLATARTRRLYAGEEPTTAVEYKAALDVALAQVALAQRSTTDAQEVRKLRKSVEILEEIKAGVIE